jgi:hypothetical protein
MRDVEAENARLRARVEELEFTVAELRGASPEWAVLGSHFGVGKKVASVMVLLSRGAVCTYNQILLAADSPDVSEYAVRTYIKHIRASSPDIGIKAMYGGCYQMTPETCALIRSLLKKEASQ